MTWIDNNGEVRPQDWNEYCETEARTRCLPYWIMGLGFNYHPKSPSQPKPRVKPKPRAIREKKTETERTLRMRVRLFNADHHCFWCGVETVFDKRFERQPNFATVDHLYSRWHPERKTRHVQSQGVLHVLACSSCNGERAGRENQSQPFIPKLPERLEFARLADATIARQAQPQQLASKLLASVIEAKQPEPEPTKPTMRVICTLAEGIKFAKENPSR